VALCGGGLGISIIAPYQKEFGFGRILTTIFNFLIKFIHLPCNLPVTIRHVTFSLAFAGTWAILDHKVIKALYITC